MLTVELRFRTGRFHATPWGRHVNEAAPEWPPSPYRLIRALYDVWQRKLPVWPVERVEPLLEKLASEPPKFQLPPAGASHTRSYLHNNTTDPNDKSLVFDGFVSVNPDVPVIITWPNIELNESENRDLAELLRLLNFFGRSESWVEATVGAERREWNCEPAVQSEADGELASVACIQSKREYGTSKRKGAPDSWLEAVTYSTTRMIKERASHAPAILQIPYVRDGHALEAPMARQIRRKAEPVTAVLYALSGKLLPRVESTVQVAEQVRMTLMGIHKRLMGGDSTQVSPKFSGHNSCGGALENHRHCFILPITRKELNKCQYIDHILVWCRDAFDTDELMALHELTRLWQAQGKPDVRCVLVSAGSSEQLRAKDTWVRSVTPFIAARYYRRGRGDYLEWLKEEIRRDCANHGLGAPEISAMRGNWRAFRRNRSEERPRWGFGFELQFTQPVQVPFSIGYGCHFGLGQFDT